MGYTHYWRIKEPQALARAMPRIAADLKRLLPHLPPLAGPFGTGKPEIGEVIAFNGVAPKDDYESFILDPFEPVPEWRKDEGHFAFCKTARRPYDLAVTATLLLARHHAGDAITVFSDGFVPEWLPAAHLIRKHLGYPISVFWALDRTPLMFRDREGRVFFYEQDNARDIGFADVLQHLDELHTHRIIPFVPPFTHVGVYSGPEDLFPGHLEEAAVPSGR